MNHSTRGRQRIIVALTVFTVALLPLTGCTSATSATSDSKALTMWTFKQAHVKALETAATAFEAKTGISVKIQAITPDSAFLTKVQAAAQTKDLPDVLEVHSGGEDRVLGGAGVLTDLTSAVSTDISGQFVSTIKDSGIVTAADFTASKVAGAPAAGIVEGARYSVPFTIGTFGIFYGDKKKLAAAGITEAPETWEAFIADLKKTVAADPATGGMSLGFNGATSTGINWILNPLAFGQLGKDGYAGLYSEDTAKDWGSANGKAALSLYAQLQGLWIPGTSNLTIDTGDQALVQGKSTWAAGGTFTYAGLVQSGMSADNILAFPLPAPENGMVKDLKLATIALTGLAVTKDSKDPSAAGKWIDFLSSSDVASKFAVDAAELPAANLGADAESILGPNLTRLTEVFAGTAEQTYDVDKNSTLFPALTDLDVAGKIVQSLSPTGEIDVPTAGNQLSTLMQNYWKTDK